MASADETSMTIHSSSSISVPEDDQYDDMDDGYDHHQPHPHNLSRLSMCTSNSTYCHDEDDDDGYYSLVEEADSNGGSVGMFMSRLSIESFDDDDADLEFSDIDYEKEGKDEILGEFSSDPGDHKEPVTCYSLPASPTRRTNPREVAYQHLIGVKEYASENESQKRMMMMKKRSSKSRTRRRRRRLRGEGWLEGAGAPWDHTSSTNYKKYDVEVPGGGGGWSNYNYNYNSYSGESESGGGGGGGGGVMVITRPKGGRRSLCMDLEEVKACRDLGFELEHERMLEKMPSHLSCSASTLDTTSSGGNSPIANWRISSPGDDPRDVKARLKVWAQAVALASSSSRHG